MSIVQLSRFFVCVVLFKRQLLYFIKSFCLCQELFYFSLSLFSSFPLPSHATAYSGYHFRNSLSTTFFTFFDLFFTVVKSIVERPHNHLTSERRRRDLNPRAAVNDLHPFQGCPFGQLGYFSELHYILIRTDFHQ